jgi:hypothetical protein
VVEEVSRNGDEKINSGFKVEGEKRVKPFPPPLPLIFCAVPTGDGGMFASTWELQCRALPGLPDHDDSTADANLSLGEPDDP